MGRRGSRSRARARRASARRKFGLAIGGLAVLLALLFAPISQTDQSNVEDTGPQASVDVLDVLTAVTTADATGENNGTSHAIDPFSSPSTGSDGSSGSDGLVALEIEKTPISARPHVQANVFGLGMEMPLVLALGRFEDVDLALSDFHGSGSRGFFGGVGAGNGSAPGEGAANSRMDVAGKGLGGPGDSGEAGNNDFTFLPDEILTGAGDRGVSPFPVANGLTILSVDSQAGAPDTETGPLAFEENLDLVPNPEPASLILLGSGLVAAATRLRRRRNA